MRRMTKLALAVLMLTVVSASVASQANAGTLFGALINLTDGPVPEASLSLSNYTGRDVRFRVWSNAGEYSRWRPVHDQETVVVWSNASYYAIEAAVWNASEGKYVVKSYAEFNRGANVWFSKVGRGEFYLW